VEQTSAMMGPVRQDACSVAVYRLMPFANKLLKDNRKTQDMDDECDSG